MSRHALPIIAGLLFLGLVGCDAARRTPRQALFEQLSARREASAEAMKLYREGMAAYEREDFEQARDCLEQAVCADSRSAHAWMALGLVAWKQDDPFEAVVAFDRAAQLEPSRFEPHYNIGGILESVGRYQQAIDKYELALRLAPNEVKVMENLARCYVRSRTKLDRALELVDRALETETRPSWCRWLEEQKQQLNGASRQGRE